MSHPKSRSIGDGDAAEFECKVKTSESRRQKLSGKFIGMVTKNAEAISNIAIFDVYILSRLTYTPRNKPVSLGKKIDLTCDAAIGIPTPKIYWQRAKDITFWNRYDESSAELAEKMMIKGNSREPSIKLQNIGPEVKNTLASRENQLAECHMTFISV